MKNLRTRDQLFKSSPEQLEKQKQLTKLSKQLKFPAGSTVTSYNATWYKSGGHAGEKSVRKTMQVAKDLKWTEHWKQTNDATGDIVSNNFQLYSPDGEYVLHGRIKYGQTAYSNSFELTLKKHESDKKY